MNIANTHIDSPVIDELSEMHSSSIPTSDRAHKHDALIARMDASLVALLKQLFPNENGLTMLALLLEQAHKQAPENATTAVPTLTIRTVDDLAAQIGCCKDTLLCYHALFTALGIVQKEPLPQRWSRWHLHIATPYIHRPELSLSALDELIRGKRFKLRTMASNVKARYLSAYRSELDRAHVLPVENGAQQLIAALCGMRAVVQQDMSSDCQKQFLIGCVDMLMYFFAHRQGDQVAALSDSTARLVDDVAVGQRIISASASVIAGDLVASGSDPVAATSSMPQKSTSIVLLPKSDQVTFESDPVALPFETKSDQVTSESDRVALPLAAKSDLEAGKSDLNLSPQAQQCYPVAEKSDPVAVAACPTLNVNVNNNNIINNLNSKITNVNVNVGAEKEKQVVDGSLVEIDALEAEKVSATQVSQMAEALADYLDGNHKYVPLYARCIREDVRAVRAGVIDVIVHKHFPDKRGPIRNLGAYFNTAYKGYSTGAAEPAPAVTRWLNNESSWQEIDETLAEEARRGRVSPYATQPAIEQTSGQRYKQSGAYNRHTSGFSSSRARGGAALNSAPAGMDEQQALQLAARMKQDCAAHGYQIDVKASPYEGVFVVDAIWDARPFTPEPTPMRMDSVAKWEEQFDFLHSSIQQALQAQKLQSQAQATRGGIA